jgi:hypothetical protein
MNAFLRLFFLAVIFAETSASAQLAPGTYKLSAPLIQDSSVEETTLVFTRDPIDLGRFGANVSNFSEGLAFYPAPTACVVTSGRKVDGEYKLHPALIFLSPEELPDRQTKIPVPIGPANSNLPYMLVTGEKAGFSGRAIVPDDPDHHLKVEYLVIGELLGPPDLEICIAIAEIINSDH